MNSLSECLQDRFREKRRPILDASAPVEEPLRVDAEGVLCLVQHWWAPEPARNGEISIVFTDFLGRRFKIDGSKILNAAAVHSFLHATIADSDIGGDLHGAVEELIRQLITARREEWWVPVGCASRLHH